MEEKPNNTRPLEFVIWSGLVLVMVGVTVAFWSDERAKRHAREEPRKNQANQGVRMVANEPNPELPVIAELPEFSLTNQTGEVVDRSDLKGRVWLADIIFTRCPGPCLTMTRRMAEIRDLVSAELPVGFLSLTTDPKFDTPAVLSKYGEHFKSDPHRWQFLTGTKQEIAKVAIDGLKLVAREKDEADREAPNDLFIHSTVFALIDKQGRLRGVKETLPPAPENDVRSPLVSPWETELKPQILKAIEQLLKEESK